MKERIIIALFLLLVGMGDWAEHHMVCASSGAEMLPISYTDEEIGKSKKPDGEGRPISCTDEEMGEKEEPEPTKAESSV